MRDLHKAKKITEDLESKLEVDIIKFFEINPHPEHGTYQFFRMSYDDEFLQNRKIEVMPNQTAKITIDDSEWHKKFKEIGNDYGVKLELPRRLYED